MWLLLDDPRLPLASALVLLLVAGPLLWRVRRGRLVRRQRAEAFLRVRHLAWVARQEAADRQREAVQHQAREIAQRIGEDLARIRRMHDAPPARPVSAVPVTDPRTARRPIGDEQVIRSCGSAEKTRRAKRSSTDRTPARSEAELRREVYALIEVDAEGWRRWRGSKDVKGYPRFWRGRKQGGWTQAYPLVYRWEQGPIPKRWTIDQACGEKDCLDHLECVTHGENLRRRHARERGELRTGHAGLMPPRRAA